MEAIAMLLCQMKAKNDQLKGFVLDLLDVVFEDMYRSLEVNDYKESQRRVSVVKFIAEAYNYKLIHTDTLMDILYRLINYDITQRKTDQYLQSLDMNLIDSFRIRLVCTILDSLGQYFWKGQRRTKMDRFLLFFQRYIYQKSYVQMDLEFMILDTLDSIRPSTSFKKYENLTELQLACERVEAFEAKVYQVGRTSSEQTNQVYDGTPNLMSPKDAIKYDDLIDGLAYQD